MNKAVEKGLLSIALSALCLYSAGCGGSTTDQSSQSANSELSVDLGESSKEFEVPGEPAQRSFQPVTLGGSSSQTPAGGGIATRLSSDEKMASVVERLKPLQIMLGQWEGKTRQKIGEFSAVYTMDWVWDFQTDKSQPALIVDTDKSPYFQSGRLTYRLDDDVYELTTIDKDGSERVFRGEFTAQPADEPGDDDQPHRTYKLELTEVAPADAPRAWQIIFNQQSNNRYLLELSEKSGSGFRRFDTVASQRMGTSFALNDADYGEKTCIISQGLGTIQVSHQGKRYWVCCTGCQAAFEEEPERWIAKLAEK
jgi:hypothetical protein